MACFSPLSAWQTDSGEVVFAERGKIRRSLTLPCGQCVGCRLERSRQWAVRCVHEAQMHEHSVFITLTYNDDFVPSDYSLVYRHFQLFMKRLRKWQPNKVYGIVKGKRKLLNPIRFYMCGEYGADGSRPHFHAILFGCNFSDRQFLRTTESGSHLYTSKDLEGLWPFGFSSVGDMTFESAAYIARYCVKAVSSAGNEWILDPETGELYERDREFTRMSLKPGIGATWFKRFQEEVFPLDRVVIRGREMKPPKYYDQLLKADTTCLSDVVEFERYKKAQLVAHDNTRERLAVRQTVAKARLNTKIRSL